MAARIVSASRRTDIPAFYSKWFINRIRAGFCVYPNPLYPKQFYRVDLRKESVLGIVFWTRHAQPLLKWLPELDRLGYPCYFQYTVLNYPQRLDPRSPSLAVSVDTFRCLSELLGPTRLIWRYDPIVLDQEMSEDWHRNNFMHILKSLAGHTKRLVVSIVDPYAKTRRRIGDLTDGVRYDPVQGAELLTWMAARAAEHGIETQSCAEANLQVSGITAGSCVDARLLARVSGDGRLNKVKAHGQRPGCLCCQSVDIGVNDTCGFGCLYCYATQSHDRAADAVRRHCDTWTCITGDVETPAAEVQPAQQQLL